jgi:hypothetical protein
VHEQPEPTEEEHEQVPSRRQDEDEIRRAEGAELEEEGEAEA